MSVLRDAGLSLAFDRQHLSAFIIAAGGANRVTGNRAAALRTLAKLMSMPAVSSFARAQPHLRCFAFGDSHGDNEESRNSAKDKCGERSKQNLRPQIFAELAVLDLSRSRN